MTRMKDLYLQKAVPSLNEKFEYKNVMQIPKLEKIVLNMRFGDCKDNTKAMEAAVDGIKMRGKATEGEKTMLDALCPALKVLQDDVTAGKSLKEALQDAAQAAEKGVEYTKTIIATKGRASYLGERSLGHQDPGATSYSYMLEVVAGLM